VSAIFNQDYLKSICAAFSVQGQLVSCDAYGNGHINDTWRIACSVDGKLCSYVLQRVNHAIFKDVPALMENVMRVCQHMAGLELENGSVDGLKKSLVLVLTKTGSPYYKTADGNFWRIYDFVENTLSVDILENETQAFQAAKSFGAFQRCLADLPGPRLNETIPNFHNTISRFAAFKAIVASDPAKRVASASSEIDFVCARENLSSSLLDLLKAGAIPERITHNDTKINNVLLDPKTGHGICVIDLDTVMPGLALYDFGDMVRSASNAAAEDETNLDLVHCRLSIFEALVRGYLEGTGPMLNKAEKLNLPLAAQVITYEIGMRFLTDYLNGDQYFKIKRPQHNLDRARNQFALVRSMEKQALSMNQFVKQFAL